MTLAKKFVALVLSCVCLFSLASCTPSDNNATDQPKTDITFSITVSAKTVLNHEDQAIKVFGEEKISSLMESEGIVFEEKIITALSDDILTNKLKPQLDTKNIPYVITRNILYGDYIASINGIGEFDMGAESGWYYFVNGVSPSYSVGKCKLKNGDKILIIYTCDGGKDIKKESNL